MADSVIEARFDAAMMEIYERAGREVAYWPTRYLQMLRRRGGLGTARYLLGTKVTSEGYARLREAGRLDLTVEALALRPEFASLFTDAELQTAGERLAQFKAMPTAQPLEPSAELLSLVDEANSVPANQRIEFRDRIAAYGTPAVTAVIRSVETGGSVALAVGVIEAVGKQDRGIVAIAALWGLRAAEPGWAAVIDQAIGRLENARP